MSGTFTVTQVIMFQELLVGSTQVPHNNIISTSRHMPDLGVPVIIVLDIAAQELSSVSL